MAQNSSSETSSSTILKRAQHFVRAVQNGMAMLNKEKSIQEVADAIRGELRVEGESPSVDQKKVVKKLSSCLDVYRAYRNGEDTVEGLLEAAETAAAVLGISLSDMDAYAKKLVTRREVDASRQARLRSIQKALGKTVSPEALEVALEMIDDNLPYFNALTDKVEGAKLMNGMLGWLQDKVNKRMQHIQMSSGPGSVEKFAKRQRMNLEAIKETINTLKENTKRFKKGKNFSISSSSSSSSSSSPPPPSPPPRRTPSSSHKASSSHRPSGLTIDHRPFHTVPEDELEQIFMHMAEEGFCTRGEFATYTPEEIRGFFEDRDEVTIFRAYYRGKLVAVLLGGPLHQPWTHKDNKERGWENVKTYKVPSEALDNGKKSWDEVTKNYNKSFPSFNCHGAPLGQGAKPPYEIILLCKNSKVVLPDDLSNDLVPDLFRSAENFAQRKGYTSLILEVGGHDVSAKVPLAKKVYLDRLNCEPVIIGITTRARRKVQVHRLQGRSGQETRQYIVMAKCL